jgi:hypothetical protein
VEPTHEPETLAPASQAEWAVPDSSHYGIAPGASLRPKGPLAPRCRLARNDRPPGAAALLVILHRLRLTPLILSVHALVALTCVKVRPRDTVVLVLRDSDGRARGTLEVRGVQSFTPSLRLRLQVARAAESRRRPGSVTVPGRAVVASEPILRTSNT